MSDGQRVLSAEDDAKLVFGTIFSLRNLVRKIGGPADRLVQASVYLPIPIVSSFLSYRTSHYKLHYYETPTSLKFVMVTDILEKNLRMELHQMYVSLYVEYGMFDSLARLFCARFNLSSCQKSSLARRTSCRRGR